MPESPRLSVAEIVADRALFESHLVEEDLIALIDSGHLAGATLDVFREARCSRPWRSAR